MDAHLDGSCKNTDALKLIYQPYFEYLKTQGEVKGLPDDLILVSQKYYDFDLSLVRYREDINTLTDYSVTNGYNIYFYKEMNFNKYRDFKLLLHELEHVNQFRMHGHTALISKYLLQSSYALFSASLDKLKSKFSRQDSSHTSLRKEVFNMHQMIDLEKEADAKAKKIISRLFIKLRHLKTARTSVD